MMYIRIVLVTFICILKHKTAYEISGAPDPFHRPGRYRPGRGRDRTRRDGLAGKAAPRGDRPLPEELRIPDHRLPALARATHDQRPDRLGLGTDTAPVRVLCARGAGAPRQDDQTRPRATQPGPRDRGDHLDDVRRPEEPGRSGEGRGPPLLRGPDLRDDHSKERPADRGAEPRQADRPLRPPVERLPSLPGVDTGGAEP